MPFPPHSGSHDITKCPTLNSINGSNFFFFLKHILQSVGLCLGSVSHCLHVQRNHGLHPQWFGLAVAYIHLTPVQYSVWSPAAANPHPIFTWVLDVVQAFVWEEWLACVPDNVLRRFHILTSLIVMTAAHKCFHYPQLRKETEMVSPQL